jgi:tyrosine-protein kinase Etk/Wzc
MKMNVSRHEVAPLQVLPPVTMVPGPPMYPMYGGGYGGYGGTTTAPGPSPMLSLADHVLQHGRLFFGIFLTVLVLGLLYLLLASPVYRADTLVQIDNRGPRNLATSLTQLQQTPELPTGYFQGEVEIIRSREIVSQAITQTRADLEVVVDNRFPLLGNWYARTFGKRDKSGPLPPPLELPFLDAFAWGGESLRIGQLVVPRPQYGKALWLETTSNNGWKLYDANDAQVAEGAVGQNVPFTLDTGSGSLQVAHVLARPGTRFKVTANDPGVVYDDMLRNLKVEEAGRQSGVIRISLNDTNPQFAVAFLDAVAKAYLEHHLRVHTGEASRSLQFLEAQLPSVKRELDRSEEALNQYRTGNNTINIGQENESSLKRIADLEHERIGIELRKEQVAQRYTPFYPEAISLQRQLASVNSEIAKLKSQMRQTPRQEKDVVRLQRDVQVNTQLYTAMMNNAQELRIAQAGMTGNARLVDPAGALPVPVRPRAGTVLPISAVLGIMAALLGVLMARMVRPTVRTSEELERQSGLHAMAAIPESAQQRALMRSRRLWRSRSQPPLLAMRMPAEPAVEALRSLRNSVALHERDGEFGTSVLITAATTEAGKSFVAANLAVLTAAAGRRVLLVDLDLRAPRLHTYFGIDRDRSGLVDVVAERCTLEEAVVHDVLPGLDVLLPGRVLGSPGDLLMQPRFEALMKDLQRQYGQVIIDSAPILPVGDTLAIGRMADLTYLVVRSEVNSHREVRDAVRRLEAAGVGVDGLILNGVKRGRLGNMPYRSYFPRDIEVRAVR